jgi:cell division initiation protein
MTPLDIRQKRFERELRGYSKREVEGFLELTAAEFEEVVKENIGLKEELKRVNARLEHHLDREKTLQETMVTAQRISEDVKATARKEAEVIVAEASLQAEKIVAGANHKLTEMVADINELRRQRVQFEAQLGTLIEAHKKLLETFKASAGPEVSFLLQKKNAAE